jgi:hypothetical protein
MPYKDPEIAKAKKRENYIANKALFIQRAKERRLRLQAERLEQKALAAIGPEKPVERVCQDCGVDITFVYNSKHGMRCSACVAKYMAEYRSNNKERIAALKKAWAEENKEHKAVQDRKYAQAKPEARRAARKKWVLLNPGKDTAAKALNSLARKKRVPGWLTPDDLWMISQAYELATLRTTAFGFKWHVDHKLPLNGKTVSGLHVPLNLQVLPWIDNLRKGNRV